MEAGVKSVAILSTIDTFDFRNATDDLELKARVERARSVLAGVSTDAIRNTNESRVKIRGAREPCVLRD